MLAVVTLASKVKSVNALHGITPAHIGHAFLIGLAAGIIAYALDVYVIASLEGTLGISAGSL